MQALRYLHRYATLVIVAFTLFLGVTGVVIQVIDLSSIALARPAEDPDVMAMREAFDGPGDFQVRQVADYTAAPLPAGFDYDAALARTVVALRRIAGAAPLVYVEFRMAGDVPVGQVGIGKGHVRIDAASGAMIERTAVDHRDSQSPPSARNAVKHVHRMTTFGNAALLINIAVSIGLVLLIVTGTLIYFKLLAMRRRIRKPGPFWSAGGTWRSLHRSVSIVAAIFLTVVTLSGAWLAVESLGLAIHFMRQPPSPRSAPPPPAPLVDARLSAMLRTTLAAAGRAVDGDAPYVVVRLRNYGGYAQGIVVTGTPDERQRLFDATSGRAMSLTEPGYPTVPFPFGWQAHQYAKSVHRGDFFGLTGRIMDLLAGLAMIYLSISGIVMYLTMWRKRRNAGRGALVWR